LSAVLAVSVLAASCAARAPVVPPAPASPSHPEFLYPTVPQGTDTIQATRIERGWRYLQSDNLRNAQREFEAALQLQPSFYPAEAALGYLELARRDVNDAVARFDRALETTNTYVPALVGRGQALLQLGRDADALTSLEAALAADPSLGDLKARIEVLRVRALQDSLAQAKAASDAGRWDEARTAYRQAIAASPESGFLYRDLGLVEQKAGRPDVALTHFRKAAEIDPADARSWASMGVVLEAQGDPEGALAAYERAQGLDASEPLTAVINRLRDAVALAKLPAEYRAIPESPSVTRGDVAALIGVRLGALLSHSPQRQAVVTDARGHWAQQWIVPVVRGGVMDTQPNYTFQPDSAVRRGDLAQTVSRILDLIAARQPGSARAWQGVSVPIADVSPAHLSYPAVSQAVASGVMPLAQDGTFQLLRSVTGAEVGEVVARLEALAPEP
jgi:tetratricopeptide (TPR) repeat protein